MEPRSMLVVAYEDAELLDIACVTSTLKAASRVTGEHHYDITLLTPGGRAISCGDGVRVEAHGALERHSRPADTLVVVGGFGCVTAARDEHLVANVRRLARMSRRVASVCTGAAILGRAGLLDGRRATTHWAFVRMVAAHCPRATIDPGPIFIRDGDVATSAGVTAALDLTLAFVAEDLGDAVAHQVARSLVTYLQRPGTQAQMSIHLASPAPTDPVIRTAVEHVERHLDADLGAAGLARDIGVSPRHLSRLFREHLGQTPGRYVRRRRTEAAAQLLTSSTLPLASIARRTGFGSTESLRTAFVEVYGVPPSRFATRHTR